MNYYPHHLGDYAKDTGHLSLLEHGAYRLLLDHYYSTEKPLPNSPDALHRICRATTKQEKEAVASIAKQFFREEDGALAHGRVEREIEEFRRKSEKAGLAGKASGEARRLKASKENERTFNGRSTDVQRTFNECSSGVQPANNQEPITSVLLGKEPKPRGRGRDDDDADFAAASAHQLDLTASTKLKAAWVEWQAYRQRRHRAKGQERLKWSLQAAQHSARQLQAAAAEHGEQIAADRISSAIVGNWQGLNFDRIASAGSRQPSTPNGVPRKFDLF